MVVSVVVGIAVPLFTLREVPRFSVWPVLLALLPWTVGKYVLCPLRWHALSESGRGCRWHLRVFAEAELFGLLTPGHLGADAWRVRRLSRAGMPRLSATAEVGLDRFVGAIGLTLFVACAASALPVGLMLTAGVVLLATVAAGLLTYRLRPGWLPRRALPTPRRLFHGVVLTIGYQATIIVLLLGTLAATGHSVSPLSLLGAFGASQLAGAVPGPNGASPKDGALVVALAALGVPWVAALGAVTLKALLAWGPALVLGGGCLLMARRLDRPSVMDKPLMDRPSLDGPPLA